MDPTATLADALTYLSTGAAGCAVDTLRDLARWIDSGGFLPDVTLAAAAAGIVTP